MTEAPRQSSCACSSGTSYTLVTDCPCSKQKEEPTAFKATVKDDGFQPKPYTFRLQQPDNGPRVRSPPFHVQLDHTIAVLWNLYRHPDQARDVGYLQWAKHFLVRIRNNHGDMPKDVESIVKAIEECLLSLYADLSKVPSYKPTTSCCTEPQHCQAKQSVTFDEMVKQQPEAVQQLFCAESFFCGETCSSHLACDCQTSKEEMAKYLKQQRAERVRIIRGELKRLQELDQAMTGVEDAGIQTAINQIVGERGASTEGVQITEDVRPDTEEVAQEDLLTLAP